MTQKAARAGEHLFWTRPRAYFMNVPARSEENMTRKITDLLFLLFLGLGIALAPIACGGDDGNNNDGAVDSMTPS